MNERLQRKREKSLPRERMKKGTLRKKKKKEPTGGKRKEGGKPKKSK